MIEKVIKKSDWAKEQATTESQNGVNTWFKIDTQVFLDKNPAAEKQVGSSRKISSEVPHHQPEHCEPGCLHSSLGRENGLCKLHARKERSHGHLQKRRT